MKALLRRILLILALAYPIALLAVIAGLRFIGEQWWLTTAALYLPRLVFALPLPALVLALAWFGPRRALWAQLAAALLLLFPLMGLRVSATRTITPGAFQLSVLSCNVDSGSFGVPAILAMVQAANADLILLQAVNPNDTERLAAGVPGYSVLTSTQFWVASRYPIEEMLTPPKQMHDGRERSPRFVRYRIETPRGAVFVYNVHPISPRDGLEDLRGNGLRHELLSGHFFSGRGSASVETNTALRLAQVQAIAADAAGVDAPLIIAGDTNLPDLSHSLNELFGAYTDGFSAVGNGFGYTFPAPRHPWMRIDRIMTNSQFRFLRFEVIRTPVSDHRAVLAHLELNGNNTK